MLNGTHGSIDASNVSSYNDIPSDSGEHASFRLLPQQTGDLRTIFASSSHNSVMPTVDGTSRSPSLEGGSKRSVMHQDHDDDLLRRIAASDPVTAVALARHLTRAADATNAAIAAARQSQH
jgi:hypothetical protein